MVSKTIVPLITAIVRCDYFPPMTIHIHPYIEKKLFSTFEKIAKESALIDNQRAESLNKKGIKLPKDLAARVKPSKV